MRPSKEPIILAIELTTLALRKLLKTKSNTVPALLAYDGIQYNSLAAHILTNEDYEYTKKYVRILSGFYGVLKPFDGVVPYRLELNNKLAFEGYNNLYQFWGNKMYQELIKDDYEIFFPQN